MSLSRLFVLGLRLWLHYFVDKAILFASSALHVKVSVGILFDLEIGFPYFSQEFVESFCF